MSIKIEVTGDTAADVRDEFARLFGWNRPELLSQAQQEADDREFEWHQTAPDPQPEPAPTEQPAEKAEGTMERPAEKAEDDNAPLYGGSGKVKTKKAERLRDEIINRVHNGVEVADDQIGRLPAKEKEAVRAEQQRVYGNPPAEEAAPEPETPTEPAAAEESAGEQQYSLDDVQTEIIRIHKDLGDGGLQKAREVFSKHGNGATKRSQIPAECVDAVVTALKEIGGS